MHVCTLHTRQTLFKHTIPTRPLFSLPISCTFLYNPLQILVLSFSSASIYMYFRVRVCACVFWGELYECGLLFRGRTDLVKVAKTYTSPVFTYPLSSCMHSHTANAPTENQSRPFLFAHGVRGRKECGIVTLAQHQWKQGRWSGDRPTSQSHHTPLPPFVQPSFFILVASCHPLILVACLRTETTLVLSPLLYSLRKNRTPFFASAPVSLANLLCLPHHRLSPRSYSSPLRFSFLRILLLMCVYICMYAHLFLAFPSLPLPCLFIKTEMRYPG